MGYPVLLRAITIDSTNNVLKFSEAGVTRTATLTAGTYYLRGDAATDDLLHELKVQMEAAGASTNTYNITVEYDTNTNNPSSTVYFSLGSGTDSFALLFGNTLTTFDATLLGFLQSNTTPTTGILTSTNSSTACWVGGEWITSYEPITEQESYAAVALSGRVRGARNGSTRELLDFNLELQPGERTHSTYNPADTAACFNVFFGVWGTGVAVELYDYEPDTGTKITSIDIGDSPGTFYLDEDSTKRFAPSRLNLATTLYSWRLLLRGVV